MSPAFVRLSESPIWEVQRAYFEIQGPRAWATGTVPHYVTCNPVMARAYAKVIVGFAADCARARGGTQASGPRTLYIVELGAGSGRLGWNLVRALRADLGDTFLLRSSAESRHFSGVPRRNARRRIRRDPL